MRWDADRVRCHMVFLWLWRTVTVRVHGDAAQEITISYAAAHMAVRFFVLLYLIVSIWIHTKIEELCTRPRGSLSLYCCEKPLTYAANNNAVFLVCTVTIICM